MSKQPGTPPLSPWQKAAREQLRALGEEHSDTLVVRLPGKMVDEALFIEISLNTQDLRDPKPGGLRLDETEDFLIAIPQSALGPPTVGVQHDRFLGFPHVLTGTRLCLYLDPSREWQPTQGMRGLMNRLWGWLDDAVNARFDPSTALYHAVGGVLHVTSGTPTIVVRHRIGDSARAAAGHLRRRTDHRYDHLLGPATSDDEIPMPVFVVPHNLPFGAGYDRLLDLLQRLDDAHSQDVPMAFLPPPRRHGRLTVPRAASAAVSNYSLPGPHVDYWPKLHATTPPPSASIALLTILAASASRQPYGAPQYLLLGVPHPASGPPHLLGLRMPGGVGDALRRAARARTTPILNLRSTDVFPDIEMEWCLVSDERAEVTVRRDEARPVNALDGKTVHVWGCGGLGSWIAEFAVRAGARKVVLCDSSTVTGGLLVRQNYVEDDVGDAKADALAQRLRATCDDVEVEVRPGMLPEDWQDAAAADLIVDATISNAIAQVTEVLALNPDRRATIVRVATDARTGTLGLAIVAAPGDTRSIQTIDDAAGAVVNATAALEDYRTFWSDPGSGEELTPTRGCSAPTFHGSAADMAGVAGTLASFIGLSMQANCSGTHLVALPFSGVTPAHQFVPHASPQQTSDTSLAVSHGA